MARTPLAVLIPILLLAAPPVSADEADDLAAARALFEANLDAIRGRDRDGYLACYLESETLVRTGPGGQSLGYEGLSAGAGDGWPEVFEGLDLRLVPLRPGLVYGSYRYRVRFDGVEQTGLSERFFVQTPGGWRIAVTTAFPAPPGTPPPPLALVGATLLDGTGAEPVGDAVVVTRGGRIECAGSRETCPVPSGVDVVDVSGRWITPGIVDAHVHFSQTGWVDGRPDVIDHREAMPYEDVQRELRSDPGRFLRSWLCSGVTTVFDVGGYPWTWRLREGEAVAPAPSVSAAGPLLSTVDFWVNLPGERQFIHIGDPDAAREGVRYLASRGTDAVKIWFIVRPADDFDALEAAVRAAVEESHARGLRVIVHATGLREAMVSVDAGADLLVHGVYDQEVSEAFLERAAETGVVYCPTLTVLDGYRRLGESILSGERPVVDDPNGCVDEETLARVALTPGFGDDKAVRAQVEGLVAGMKDLGPVAAANLTRVHAAGIPIAMGTDAGNPLTLHGPSVYGEMEAMQAAGMSPMEVLVASTRDGARALGRLEDTGTLEAGKAADLIVVAADPAADIANLRALRRVMRGGVLRTREELRAREPESP